MANYDVELLTITKVDKHPNADRLDVIELGGWISVAELGRYKAGDTVIFIHPDAKLDLTRSWTNAYSAYVSPKKCRVKTIKLRGVFTEGIIVSPADIKDMVDIEGITDPDELAKVLGITHYEMPYTGRGVLNIRYDMLPYSLAKTDQTTVQQLGREAYVNRAFLVTRKMDGSSCTITVENVDGKLEFHVASRRYDLKLDVDNIYTAAARSVVDAVTKYFDISTGNALQENQVLVLRGEVCGENIHRIKYNIDCHGAPTFYLFEGYIMNKVTHQIERRYKHMDLAYVLGIESVPLIEVKHRGQVTDEVIQQYLVAPKEHGEGVVLWEIDDDMQLTGHSFKIRSKNYDCCLD